MPFGGRRGSYIRELKTLGKPLIPNQGRKEYSVPGAAAEIFLLVEKKLEPLKGRKFTILMNCWKLCLNNHENEKLLGPQS